MQAPIKTTATLIAFATASLGLSVTAAGADIVNITADDGRVTVSGQVASVSDRSITVLTDVGVLTFDIDTVECTGFGCPRAALDKVQTTSSSIK